MRKLPLILTGSIIVLLSGLSAQAFLWDGGGADDNWGTGANWSPDGAPSTGTGMQIDFAGSTRLTPFWNYGSFDQMGSIFFDSGAGAFTLNGTNAMKVFSKIENSGTTLQTVSISSIVLNGTTATEINPVSGDLVINSALILDTPQLRIFGSSGKTVTFNGVISNGSATNPSVAINQNSNVVYQNAMTYTGDTFVNAGKLQFSTGGSAANSSIRIGDTATTAVAAEVDLLPSAGGLTLSNTFNSRAGNTGAATIASQNTSGTNTLSGHIALDKAMTITQAAGGTLNITQVKGGDTTTANDIKGFTETLTAAALGTINISGTIYNSVGTGNLVLNGAGTVTLSGNNTYGGTTTGSVSGTLNINSATAIGTGALVIGSIYTIDNTSGAAISLTNSNALTLSGGSLTVTGTASGTTHDLTFGALTVSVQNRMITVSGAGTTLTTGAVNDAGGSRQLTKDGAGSLVLSAAAGTWTGGTVLIAGAIGIGNNTALGTGPLSLGGSNGNTPTIIASGGARTISNNVTLLATSVGGNPTISGSNALTLNGTLTNSGNSRTLTVNNSALTTIGGSVYLSESAGTGRTLTINGSGNTTISGAISNFNGSGTAGGLTYAGTGTLSLSGTGTYTGATLVSNGTLTAGATDALKTTSGITVNTGGTLLLSGLDNRIGDAVPLTLGGGTFHTGGLSETLGTLTLSANSIIDFGNGTSTLTFADSSGATWAGSFRLSIYNWGGNTLTGGGTDQLRFLSNGLSSTQLARIDFYSGSTAETKLSITPSFFANGFVGGAGEVTPVPEPSSVATVMGLLGLIGWRERRKMLRERAADRRMILA